jgi:endonuclease/exonuclease/phosphatase family metal-dependent hydrolase
VGIVESARTLNVKTLRRIALFLLIVGAALGADLKVATLNCYLLFDPAINHRGKVDDDNRMTSAQYQQKLTNLATLTKGYDVVALQEIGGKAETAALAKAAGFSWAWTQGRDTATGQEVALLHNLPNWQVTSKGRVAELDRVVSKHLLVLATKGQERVYFLAVHLLRPIGAQQQRQEGQRKAIGAWAQGLLARESGAAVVILGDTNNSSRESLYGLGSDAGELNGYASTHLTNKCYDRLVVAGNGKWIGIEILKPPYGRKPNDTNKRVWTDHYFVGAVLRTTTRPRI